MSLEITLPITTEKGLKGGKLDHYVKEWARKGKVETPTTIGLGKGKQRLK